MILILFDVGIIFTIVVMMMGAGGMITLAQWILLHPTEVLIAFTLKSLLLFTWPAINGGRHIKGLRLLPYILLSVLLIAADIVRDRLFFQLVITMLQPLFSYADLISRVMNLIALPIGGLLVFLCGFVPVMPVYLTVGSLFFPSRGDKEPLDLVAVGVGVGLEIVAIAAMMVLKIFFGE